MPWPTSSSELSDSPKLEFCRWFCFLWLEPDGTLVSLLKSWLAFLFVPGVPLNIRKRLCFFCPPKVLWLSRVPLIASTGCSRAYEWLVSVSDFAVFEGGVGFGWALAPMRVPELVSGQARECWPSAQFSASAFEDVGNGPKVCVLSGFVNSPPPPNKKKGQVKTEKTC